MMVGGPTTWSIKIAIYLTGGEWSYFSKFSMVRVLLIGYKLLIPKCQANFP